MKASGLLGYRFWCMAAIASLASGCIVRARPGYVDPEYGDPQYGAQQYGAQQGGGQQGGGQQGGDDVAVEDFYEPLSAHGAWIDDPQYGRVWQPNEEVVGEDFVPYASGGSWVESDDGYAFESQYDTDWGWATYHYGRWYQNDEYGWVWVPGNEWAPSWVEWRYGGGYVGWVPMAPPNYVVAPDHWVFVEERYFGSPGVITYRIPPERTPMVYVVAVPITTVSVHGRWRVGPPASRIRAGGGAVRRGYVARPARGVTRARARGYAAAQPHTGGGYNRAAAPHAAKPGGHPAAARPGGSPNVSRKATPTPKRRSSKSKRR